MSNAAVKAMIDGWLHRYSVARMAVRIGGALLPLSLFAWRSSDVIGGTSLVIAGLVFLGCAVLAHRRIGQEVRAWNPNLSP